MSQLMCHNCQAEQSTLTQPLKRCARCQDAWYCSTDCQRADWPIHKQHCHRVETSGEGNAKIKTTFRIRMGNGSLPVHEMIYFIRKSTPHWNDITISGPFFPRETIAEQLKGNLHRTSQDGMSTMSELEQDADTLAQLQWIKAPLDTDPSHTIFLEVIEKHNPVMAAQLPGPAYSVISSVPLMPHEIARREAHQGRSPYPRVANMEVHGCYASVGEANARAKEILLSVKQDMDQSPSVEDCTAEGSQALSYAVVGRGRDGKVKAVGIEVRLDTGEIQCT